MPRFPPPELPGSGSRGQQARPAFSAASSGAAPPASFGVRPQTIIPGARQVKGAAGATRGTARTPAPAAPPGTGGTSGSWSHHARARRVLALLSQPPRAGRLPQRRSGSGLRPLSRGLVRSREPRGRLEIPLVRRRRQLLQVPVAHLAAGHTTRARGGIEHVVRPATERAVVPEHDLRVGPDAPEVVVRRIDLGGERAGVETALRGQHREAAHAAGAEAVEVGLAVAVVGQVGTRAGRSEEHTSELQSLAYLVCRLLLEKKKKKNCRPPPSA